MNQSHSRLNKNYTLTFIALISLFVITFVVAHIDLGPFNTATGLLIAAAKAILVALNFMHLRNENGIHRVAAIAGLFWLGILFSLSLTDYLSRSWMPLPGAWP